jgi:hypothetical protein
MGFLEWYTEFTGYVLEDIEDASMEHHLTYINFLQGENKRILDAVAKESFEIEQTLAQEIGSYPWYVNDQKNFPGATAKDGVCVGDHVPASLAAEAVGQMRKMRLALANILDHDDGNCLNYQEITEIASDGLKLYLEHQAEEPPKVPEKAVADDDRYIPALSIKEAQEQKVCRYCLGPDTERPFTLNFGREYAHKRCAPQARGDKGFEECIDTIRDVMHAWHNHYKRATACEELCERAKAEEEKEKASEAWKKIRPALRKLLEMEPRSPHGIDRTNSNFHEIDVSVHEALQVYFSHGYDGGSFVTALLAQDYEDALLHAHEHLSERSIKQHMELAAKMMKEHEAHKA